jgi:hypothetical protein
MNQLTKIKELIVKKKQYTHIQVFLVNIINIRN